MDSGNSLENPYGGVNIPRAQLKSSFVRNTIGGDLDLVIANPSVVPTYPSYSTQDRFSNESPTAVPSEGNKIRTQESWRRPYNPYAPDLSQNGGHSSAMYTIDVDKRHNKRYVKEEEPCCCYPCCKCCSCCRKSCCVIS